MLGPVGHIGAGLAYFATARRQHTSDSLTAKQLAWAGELPRGLELTWLGTAGFRFAYQGVRPLGDAPRFSFNVNLTQFADEVHRASRSLPVHTLELGCAIGS